MHIHKFADMARFDEIAIGGTLPATEEYRDFLKKLHPTQILNGRVVIPFYEVVYSYRTVRGNERTGKKYVLLRQEHEDSDMEIEMLLRSWVESRNMERPYRRISNVKILDIQPMAYATITFDP